MAGAFGVVGMCYWTLLHLRSGALRGAARVTVSPLPGRKMRLEPVSEGF